MYAAPTVQVSAASGGREAAQASRIASSLGNHSAMTCFRVRSVPATVVGEIVTADSPAAELSWFIGMVAPRIVPPVRDSEEPLSLVLPQEPGDDSGDCATAGRVVDNIPQVVVTSGAFSSCQEPASKIGSEASRRTY